MQKIIGIISALLLLTACGGRADANAGSGETGNPEEMEQRPTTNARFDADSAYAYVKKQVEFGPRVPNSAAHRAAGDWLVSELKRHGAEVAEQRATLRAFDGTRLNMRNIMGSFNPAASDRLLLLAHYDTRPWADQDPDESNHDKPIDGANDGASGVGVLLEIARQLSLLGTNRGIDILFTDCEDYGGADDEESWALGAQYFASHPIKDGYRPWGAILLDMVGGYDARFGVEYFSQKAAPELDNNIRQAAQAAGHGNRFPRTFSGAVNDDHVPLIEAGIPAIDIIDYRPHSGFCPTWHTAADNMANIDRESLRAVGETLMKYLAE